MSDQATIGGDPVIARAWRRLRSLVRRRSRRELGEAADRALFGADRVPYLSLRDRVLTILIVERGAPERDLLNSDSPTATAQALLDRQIDRVCVRRLRLGGRLGPIVDVTGFAQALAAHPDELSRLARRFPAADRDSGSYLPDAVFTLRAENPVLWTAI